jgi:hypothetical protein
VSQVCWLRSSIRLIALRLLLRITLKYDALVEENGALRKDLECAHGARDDALNSLEQHLVSSHSNGTGFSSPDFEMLF